MYTGFAEVYDQLMDNVDYERWADLYRDMMVHYGLRGGNDRNSTGHHNHRHFRSRHHPDV